ncbi:hypothetical protein AGDE_15953 [Angomonas deanei]|uniref:TAP-like protein, putative n=1 Tax=Angomonas deanei TaxID=59799 RepID=A0A7G2CQJ7_9TRYP|nr:hypothetical protein AGDE_15953 [Angomonas deanei]CAD2221649.1 TAP-like protein, putative [Angomonas deanei]|eukprot:EPY18080.1 hypothetical protein AGDE_15953 [Angomonas deanei]
MVRFIPRESVSKKFQKKCDEIQQNTKLSKKEKETLLSKVNQEKTYYRAKLYTECFYNFANSISGEHQHNTISEKPSFRILPDPKYNSNNNVQTPFYIVVPQTKNGKANFALDKEKCQKQFLRVFLRSGRLIDNAPRQYGALLTAPPRGAKLAATITSQRPNNNTTNTNNKYYLPTSIIQGTRDPLCPYENAFALQDAIEGSALFSVLGLGHVLHPSLRDVFVTVIWQSMEEGERFYIRIRIMEKVILLVIIIIISMKGRRIPKRIYFQFRNCYGPSCKTVLFLLYCAF